MREDYTKLEVKKTTLARLNAYKNIEAGRRWESGMTHESFLHFLLILYDSVGNDDIILDLARKKSDNDKLKRIV